LLPGHPLEINLNLRGFKTVIDYIAQEIQYKATCAAYADSKCGAALDQKTIFRHFVPSMDMLLNYLQPLRTRERLPDECQEHELGTDDKKPIFGQSFWDDSAISTVLSKVFKRPTLSGVQFWNPPETCSYESWSENGVCAIEIYEPLLNANFQVGIHSCPNTPTSVVPYVSVHCDGDICDTFMRPCSVDVPFDEEADECNFEDTGNVCRALSEGGGDFFLTNYDQIIYFMQLIGLTKEAVELSKCGDAANPGIQGGLNQKFKQLQKKLFDLFNFTAVGDAKAIGFCMPAEDPWADMQKRIWQSWNEYYEEDITSATIPNKIFGKKKEYLTKPCTDKGCDPRDVGDGRCDMNCYNEECKFDGGDCGGTSYETATWDLNPGYVNADSSIPNECKILPADVTAAKLEDSNMWEPCNGAASCDMSKPVPVCLAPCGGPGNTKCENIKPVDKCKLPGQCTFKAWHLTGIQDRVRSWDPPILPGNVHVFEFDRMTGVNYTTPAAQFEIDLESRIPADRSPRLRPVAQMTCAGELGLVGINGNLQFGIHAPWFADSVNFLGAWISDIATCRFAYHVSIPANLPVPPPATLPSLKQHMIETRFMFHHPAFWAYQYFYLGNSPIGLANNLNEKICKALDGKPACFHNTLWDRHLWDFDPTKPIDPSSLIFGMYNFWDPLSKTPNFVREPNPFDATYKWTLNNYYVAKTVFSKNFRMFAIGDRMQGISGDDPNNYNSNCNWDSTSGYRGMSSATTFNDPQPRRCQVTKRAMTDLFATRAVDGNIPFTYFDWHFDFQIDKAENYNVPFCAGAATGAVDPKLGPTPTYTVPGQTPYPTQTLSVANNYGADGRTPRAINSPDYSASYGLTPFTVAHEGFLTEFIYGAVPCKTDLECKSLYSGSQLYCQDLDKDFLNLKGWLNPRNVDPFAQFVYGLYNSDRGPSGCSSTSSLGYSIRQFLNFINGKPRDGDDSYADALKFCLPNFNVFNGVQKDPTSQSGTWKDNNWDYGTCNPGETNYWSDFHQCIMASPTAAVTPGKPASLLTAKTLPLQLNLAPLPSYSGVMPAVACDRCLNLEPVSSGANGVVRGYFVIGIPTIQKRMVNNHLKEKIRYSIATAFSSFGLPLEPSGVLFKSVEDRPGNFPRMQDGTSAGIEVTYSLDIGNKTIQDRYVRAAQGADQNFKDMLGPTLAILGLFLNRYSTNVYTSFYERPTIDRSVKPNAGAIAAGVLFGLGAAAAAGYYYMFGNIAGYTVGGTYVYLKGMVDPNAKKGNPNRKVGESVKKPKTPIVSKKSTVADVTRKSSVALTEVENPMNEAIDGALASTSAAGETTTTTDGSVVVVNAMRLALEPVGVETVQEQPASDVGSAYSESMPGEVVVSTEETAIVTPDEVTVEGVDQVLTTNFAEGDGAQSSVEVVEQQLSETPIVQDTSVTEEVVLSSETLVETSEHVEEIIAPEQTVVDSNFEQHSGEQIGK
jgi:hypothetical protein